MPGRPRWCELGRNHRLRDYWGHPCHARSSTANTYSMEPHELALRGIAMNYGWTWYRMRRLKRHRFVRARPPARYRCRARRIDFAVEHWTSRR